MDIVHRLHYLVLTQKSDLMTMEREQRMRMRRQSSLPDYSKGNKTRRLEQAYFNDVSCIPSTYYIIVVIGPFRHFVKSGIVKIRE